MIGKLRIGVTVMGAPSSKCDIRVMHIRRGLPLISALHDPQRPALQFQRTASDGSCLAWMSWMASSTTIPGYVSTS